MKETIYTIPVRDAFTQSDGDCPVCVLHDQLTEKYLAYYLGSALMEPDSREFTNRRGFCRTHAQGLYRREENRLGLALTLHTRIRELRTQLDKAKSAADGRRRDRKKRLLALADRMQDLHGSCAVCERLDETMEHYLDVICWMYEHDPEFYTAFRQSHHFCLEHAALLLDAAIRHMKLPQAERFFESVFEVMNRSLAALDGDVEWFTQKFDYRNHDKSWKNSRDAVIRAVRDLHGGVRRSVVRGAPAMDRREQERLEDPDDGNGSA